MTYLGVGAELNLRAAHTCLNSTIAILLFELLAEREVAA